MRTFDFTHAMTLDAPPGAVAAVLLDLERYPEWWPQVRAVARIDDDHARVVCRSALPYDLELVLGAVSRSPERLEVSLEGRLEGFARYLLVALEGAGTRLDYVQRVRVHGAALTAAAYLGRPVLSWNHAVMMRGCETGLRARLATG